MSAKVCERWACPWPWPAPRVRLGPKATLERAQGLATFVCLRLRLRVALASRCAALGGGMPDESLGRRTQAATLAGLWLAVVGRGTMTRCRA